MHKVYSEEQKKLVFEEPKVYKEVACIKNKKKEKNEKDELSENVKKEVIEKLYHDFIKPQVHYRSTKDCSVDHLMKDNSIFEVKEIALKEQKNFKILLLIRDPKKFFEPS